MSIKPSDLGTQLFKLSVLKRLTYNKMEDCQCLHFAQLPILEFIIANDDCTQKLIAEKMQVSPPSVATSTKRLQKAGLIEKKADKNNLRCNRLSATELGKHLAEKRRRQRDYTDELMFKGFSQEEMNQLAMLLDKAIMNLNNGEPDDLDMVKIMSLHHHLHEHKGKNHYD